MSTLTLTFDDDLVSQAQEYARRTGTDLSVLVAELLRPVVAKSISESKALPPELAALYGCISLPPGYNYKEHLGSVFNDEGNQ
jgi:hypothetical protein